MNGRGSRPRPRGPLGPQEHAADAAPEGADAKATYAQRLAVGIDAFRGGIRSMFLGT